MINSTLIVPVLSAVFIMCSGSSSAGDAEHIKNNIQTQKQVYGRELMTKQERAEHHKKMQAAETEQERQQIRRQQHEAMKQRASEKGLSMPDDPPAKKSGRAARHKTHEGSGNSD